MTALSAACFAAALILCAAGLVKARQPAASQRAAAGQGLPVPDWLVRLFGLVEVVVGLSVITVGGALAMSLQAVLYAGFAAFVVRGLLRGDLSSCGCFGASDRPPTWTHVVVNGILAAASGWSAVAGAEPLLSRNLVTTAAGSLTIVMIVVNAVLIYLVLARTGLERPDAA